MTAIQTLRNKFRFDKDSPWYFYRKVIWWSFVVSACITIPFIIVELIKTGSAIFLYYGDYNAQQICFYEHAVDMAREGSFGWDWVTDMGSNFIGSYSYYMLGSPFYWLMCIFPSAWTPYLMGPMYMVKYIVAAVLAYAYLQRFVKNKNYAVIGAMLYSFSGFQIYNTFFNQFHDCVAFFPLLLIAMEELVQNDRKGLFAIAVMLNAMINYFMFAGQVVFCIFYFLARFTTKSFKITFAKFMYLALEAVIGVLLAMFIFLPAASALMGNSRISSSMLDHLQTALNKLKENDMEGAWKSFKKLFIYQYSGDYYWQRYGQIFESYFFPPDIPSRVNFFYGHETRWASISMYLPMFGMTGFFALFTTKRRSWLKRFIIFLIVASFVPILNSSFFLFNQSYYARWLYMMIMMLTLATVISLDDSRTKWKVPVAISTVICTLVTVPLGLIWHENEDEVVELGYPPFIGRFWLYVAIAFLGIILTAWLIRKYRGTKKFEQAVLVAVSCVTVLYSCVHIINGKTHSQTSEFMVDQVIEGTIELPDPHEEFFRLDQFKTSSISTIDNLGIYWNYPTIECFHTVVPPSIMEFYPMIGVTRNVGSRAESKLYGLRAFTSVKYSVIETKKNKKTVTKTVTNPETGAQEKIKETQKAHNTYGFNYLNSQNGYDIYENEYYIPMGFAYTEFMTESDFKEKYNEEERHILLCKYLIVPDDKADYYSRFMTRVIDNGVEANKTEFVKAVNERRLMCCDDFNYSTDGFDATITLDKPSIVFFSVPYEEYGWSATVNGHNTEVLRVTSGFVAVECQAGDNKIVFDYSTPGLVVGTDITLGEITIHFFGGIWWTLIGVVLYAAYMIVFKAFKKQKAETKFFSFDYYDDMDAFKVDEPKINDVDPEPAEPNGDIASTLEEENDEFNDVISENSVENESDNIE